MLSLEAAPLAPGRLPEAGHIGEILHDPVGFFSSLHPVGRLVRVDLGNAPVYVVTDADLAHQVFVAQARCFDKGRNFDQIRIVAGDGLVSSYRALHRKQRRILQPLFRQHHLAHTYAPAISDEVRRATEMWQPHGTLEFRHVAAGLARSILVRTLFPNSGADAIDAICRVFDRGTGAVFARAVTPPGMHDAAFTVAAKRVQRLVDELINSPGADQGPLLSTLLTATDEDTGQPVDRDLIRDELITFLFAGAESTASILAWLFYELGQQTDLERELHNEVDTVIGARPVDFDDITRLPFTSALVQEALRLYGIVLITRRAVAPAVLADTHIPPGTELLISPPALHRDHRTFTTPNQFHPHRWLVAKEHQPPRHSVMPFGKGPRNCIGSHFAMMELVIAVATIATRWSLHPTPACSSRPIPDVFLQPGPLPMTAVPRLKK